MESMISGIRPLVAAVATLVPAALILQVRAEEPTRATLCDLMKTPERFNGKIVRVRANVITSMEIGGLQDKSCSAWVHLAYSGDTYMSGHEGEQFAFVPVVRDSKNPYQLIWDPTLPKPAQWDSDHPPPNLKWKTVEIPQFISRKEDEELRKLEKYSGQKYTRRNGDRCWHCPLYKVVATVTGRFDHSDTPLVAFRTKPGSIKYQAAGFGHLNAALSQLVLQSVSDVVATPIDASVYENER